MTTRNAPASIEIKTGSRTADPRNLELEGNIRTNPEIASLVADIKERGIIQPLLVEPGTELDQYRVIDGQRRVLAALELGITEIPIHVQPAGTEEARILDQLRSNLQRDTISRGDQVAAVQTLVGLGMTAAAIVKKTTYDKKTIDSVVAIGKSETATALLATAAPLDLETAAALAEAEAELPTHVMAELAERAAKGYQISREIERRVSDARHEKEKAAAVEKLTAEGIEIVASDSTGYTSTGYHILELAYLYATEARDKTISKAKAKEAAGADLVGWAGYSGGKYVVQYGVRNWWEHGLFAPRGFNAPTKTAAGDTSEADKEKRRTTIANNKAWPIATDARLKWIRETLLAGTNHTDPSYQSAIALGIANTFPGEPGHSRALAYDWLGINAKVEYQSPEGKDLTAWLATRPKAGATLALAFVIAATESDIGKKDGWRPYEPKKLAAYLAQLVTWGYTPSELEQTIIKENKR